MEFVNTSKLSSPHLSTQSSSSSLAVEYFLSDTDDSNSIPELNYEKLDDDDKNVAACAKLIKEIVLQSGGDKNKSDGDIEVNVVIRKKTAEKVESDDSKTNEKRKIIRRPKRILMMKCAERRRMRGLFSLSAAPILIALRNLGWVEGAEAKHILEREVFKVNRNLERSLIGDYKEPLYATALFCKTGDNNNQNQNQTITASASIDIPITTTEQTTNAACAAIIEKHNGKIKASTKQSPTDFLLFK